MGLHRAVATRPLKRENANAVHVSLRHQPSPTPHIERYVDSKAAADFLGLHPKTVERMARRGELPGHPVGAGERKRWRFLLSELDAEMRSRVVSRRHPCREDRSEANV